MKKTIRCLLRAFMLTLVFCVSVAAAEQTGAQLSYVTDSAELLSENENMRLEKVFPDDFKNNDWYDGFEDYIKECSSYLEKAAAGKPVRASALIPCLIVVGLSLLATGVIVTVIWEKMNSVSEKVTANAYISDTLQLTEKTDCFTHKTTSRRKIERSSSGGGSSRSESGGGGSGRSGKF